MSLLFSFLDSPPPLSSRTAGYWSRVVSNLLLRKTNEAMQYLQANEGMLEKLARHIGTTSVAEVLKRLVGGDEQSSMLFLPQYAQWLADTPLVEMLLAQLSADSSADAQANAAHILSSIAHTQPSALASKLTSSESIAALFSHALAPSHQLLVPALDVCIALVEPKRCAPADEPCFQEQITQAKNEAVDAMVQHLPSLVGLLSDASDKLVVAPSETPYGVLSPPLGRARLKIVDLLAVLFRSGCTGVEPIMMQLEAVQLCCRLFSTYPFNNLLHHCVTALLVASLTCCSEAMLRHVFEHCKLLDWITNLQVEVRPTPLPGQEELAGSKPSIRAGYMGHVTQLASTLEGFTRRPHSSSSSDTGHESPPGGEEAARAAASATPESRNYVVQYLEGHAGWHGYVNQQLHYQQELENTSRWQCGRPIATHMAGLDDGDDFQVGWTCICAPSALRMCCQGAGGHMECCVLSPPFKRRPMLSV